MGTRGVETDTDVLHPINQNNMGILHEYERESENKGITYT